MSTNFALEEAMGLWRDGWKQAQRLAMASELAAWNAAAENGGVRR